MTNKTEKMQASGSKRAASSSPSRSKTSKRQRDGRESDHSDSSSKNSRGRNEEDEDKFKMKSKRITSDERRAKRNERQRGSRDSVEEERSEISRSSSGSSSSSEQEEGELKTKQGGRYWGGDSDPPSDNEDKTKDYDEGEVVKGSRYWGIGPDKDDVEDGELSSHSQDGDYEVGKRYYDDKPSEENKEEKVDKEPEKEYVIGQRYYDDKPENEAKEPDSKNEKKEEVVKAGPTRRSKLDDPLLSRTGGAYIPPAKLRLMQASITDKSSVSYQRIAWEALKKSIHGHINKVNTSNIGIIARLLMKENIIRGRGLLCRSLLQAQAASTTFTNVYACLVSVINSKFPNIGELLMKRVILQFKRGFKRNDKALCIASCQFIAHLVNQQVAHEILALEMLTLLLESPTDDSVEVAVAFLKEVGQKLLELSPKGSNAIFDMLRNILHQGNLEKRVQYMIEVVFQVRKDGFRSFQSVDENLDLVEEEDRYTHILTIDEAVDPEDMLNVFKHDLEYELNEDKYKALKEEIIGGSSSEEESGEDSGEESDEDGSEDEDEEGEKKEANKVMIIDETETNLVALRRTIYLTIQSSLDFEECCHKLLKMDIKPGQEAELCHMLLDCCAELRTYEKFFGLLAQRFCQINRIYITPLEEMFAGSYATVHRLDTNKLRNVARFFGHLLFTDAISWQVLETVRLNEEETTSSSRIFIKILFQELAEYMGLSLLNQRLKDPTLQTAMEGLFPRDNPKNTRFAINFFTSVGLGGLTDELREHLKTQPKPSAVAQLVDKLNLSSDSSSSSSESSSSESSSSDSENENEKTKKKNKAKEKGFKKDDKLKKNGTKDTRNSRDNKKPEKDQKKSRGDQGSPSGRSSIEKEFKRKVPNKYNRNEDERHERNGDRYKVREKDSGSYRRDEDKSKDREKETRRKDDQTWDMDREKRRSDRDAAPREKDNRRKDYDIKVTTKNKDNSKTQGNDNKEKQKKYHYDDRSRVREKDNRKKEYDDSKEKYKKYSDDDKPREKEKEVRKKDYDNTKENHKKYRDDDRPRENLKKAYDDTGSKDKENRRRDYDEPKEKQKERYRRSDDKHKIEKERRNDREADKYKSTKVYDDERDRRTKDRSEKRHR